MKRISYKWKYLLASLLLANNIACSHEDLTQLVSRQEQDSGSRTTELVTKTITLDTAGTLETKVSEAMGDAEVATLEKLVLSGPFTSTDMQYVRDSLTGLKVLDMKGTEIKASDVAYKYDSWAESVFEDNKICYRMFSDMDGLKEVNLPVAVAAMDDYAFYDCDSLRSVSLPDSLKSIGSYAFFSCDSLSAVTLPSKLKTISGGAFEYCYSLKEIVLPESLETLGGSAFRVCKKISSIKIPGKVKTVENFCFYGCDSMAEIVFSEGVETIGNHSFAGAHQVKTLDFPASLRTISDNAFYSCNSLQMITIPETVTSVGSDFVRDCSNLRAIVWKAALDVPYCSGVYDCFLFVYTDRIGVESLYNWKSIIINDVSESTINVDDGDYRDAFANAKEFTAKKLVYNRYFSDETQPGGSSGWQTIVLPFTPDSIYHETKGQIAPFNSGVEGAKPFWLRELTNEGFVDVTTIEPNKPYIIAMPNHSDYLDEYRLNGTITFVARDSVLRVTPDELTPSVGPEFELHPTYRYVESSSDIYFLGTDWNYYEEEQMYYSKSFFKKNDWGDVRKFNAYVTTLGGGRSSRSKFDLDTRSKETRAVWQRNTSGIPQIGDM